MKIIRRRTRTIGDRIDQDNLGDETLRLIAENWADMPREFQLDIMWLVWRGSTRFREYKGYDPDKGRHSFHLDNIF